MKETERTKRGEAIFERIREMSMAAHSEAQKNNEPVPHYLIIGPQEAIDLSDYCFREKHMSVFSAPGTGNLFGLTFIYDEREILRLGEVNTSTDTTRSATESSQQQDVTGANL